MDACRSRAVHGADTVIAREAELNVLQLEDLVILESLAQHVRHGILAELGAQDVFRRVAAPTAKAAIATGIETGPTTAEHHGDGPAADEHERSQDRHVHREGIEVASCLDVEAETADDRGHGKDRGRLRVRPGGISPSTTASAKPATNRLSVTST